MRNLTWAVLIGVLTVAHPASVVPVVQAATTGDVDRVPVVKTTTKKNAYAVVIGIEQYREKLPNADFAARDAKLMGEYLTKVLGYPEENVVVRLNDKATGNDLVKYFDEWLRNNVEAGGSVFIYYSGHGAPNTKTGDAYLVPYDGDPTFIESTGYPVKRLYAALEKLPAAEIVVVLDSCFSGAGGRSVIAKGSRPMVLSVENPVIASGKTVVLAASAGDQVSSTYEEKRHGLLTYFFLKGLQGEGDTNKDGVIEMAELYEYVKPNVQRVARKQYNNEQTPQLLASPDLLKKGGGRLVEGIVGGMSTGTDLEAERQRLRAEREAVEQDKRQAQERAKPGVDRRQLDEERRRLLEERAQAKPLEEARVRPYDLPKPQGARQIGKDNALMVFIPEGPFLMGGGNEDPQAASAEKPQRTVIVDGFWADVFEVTNAQYKLFRDESRYHAPFYVRDPRFNGPYQPVVGVNWEDAQAYCRWAGKRLPTEAEWEKAARGTDGRLYPWGDAASLENAHLMQSNPSDVGRYPRGGSPYGVQDMAGNVWEWVQDWYDPGVYRKDAEPRNPKGPPMGGGKVLRGGSWWERDPSAARATARHHQPPDRVHNNVGFRCALSGTEGGVP